MKNKILKRFERTDTPNVTYEKLVESGWIQLDYKYEYMIRAILNMIQSELGRLYWNKNQEEMVTPFVNSGEIFENAYVTIRAYDWNENELPNFDTDELKIFWYKHSNRGVCALIPPNKDVNTILVDVLNQTIQSLKDTYEEC